MAVADALPLPQSQDVMICQAKAMRLLLIILLVTGCAIQNPEINNVEGNWEFYGHIYQRIEINKDGQGYLVVGLEDEIELCKIQRIVLTEKQIMLEIKCEESEKSISQISGYVTPTSVVIDSIIKEGKPVKFETPMVYLNESLAESSRKKAKKRIAQEKLK